MKKSWIIRLSALGVVLGIGPGVGGATSAAPPQRVIIISWDGAADWVVDRLLLEGRLPNVARLAKEGVRAEYCQPAFPSKTAPGHAALWTGVYSDVNGVSGNLVPLLPRAEHTLLEQRSGFDAVSLRAEPLYVTAARAGKNVAALSATHSSPATRWFQDLPGGVPPGRYRSFSGFDSSIADDRVWDGGNLQPAQGWPVLPDHRGEAREMVLRVADATFYGLAYDDPADPKEGFDTLLLRQGSKDGARARAECTLKPAEAEESVRRFSPRFRISRGAVVGYTYFRLFSLEPGGWMVLYQRAAHGLQAAASTEETRAYLDAYGGFHAAPFDAYTAGKLGPPLAEGGDGTAERRLLECIRLDCEFLKRGTRFALQQWSPDLLHHYVPWTDAAGHTWMGVLDPDSSRYDAALAGKLWPFYAQVFALQDEWLGDIRAAAGPQAVLCLVSDHGMEGVGKRFTPNAVLEQAGLLARTPAGGLDLARTKICAPPWADYFLTVNGTEWKDGVVPSAEREAVLRAATQALLAAVDPETGQKIVKRVLRPSDEPGLGMGGPAGGDLYLDLAPGYTPSARAGGPVVEPVAARIGAGVHGFLPLRPKMHSIFYLAGEGVAAGQRLPGMRQIDVAPTLARLLGVPAPKDARGRVLEAALMNGGR